MNAAPPSDDDLVQRAKSSPSGDLRAFDELIRRYQDRVLANCRYLSGSADDAEDLAQGVFVKAFFGLKRFEGRSQFGTWVQRIKINHCLNFIRSRKGRVTVDADDPVTQMQPEMQVASRADRGLHAEDAQARIRAVLDDLPESLRVPLIMRDLDEMPYQEIADDLGLGLSAVKMRIKRGREEFRRLYQAQEDQAP